MLGDMPRVSKSRRTRAMLVVMDHLAIEPPEMERASVKWCAFAFHHSPEGCFLGRVPEVQFLAVGSLHLVPRIKEGKGHQVVNGDG